MSRDSVAKRNAAPKSVEEYLAAVPEPARRTLNKVRAVIRSAVPPETTEAIGYRIPTFKYKGPWWASPRFRTIAVCFP